MMPIQEPHSSNVNYKQKYKTLKRKLRFLVYEQECFLEELKRAQRKLLKVSRDKSFLLDRLLQYEKIDDSSSDSDATASSESEAEAHKDGPGSGKKKKSSVCVQLPMFQAGDSSMNPALGFAGMLPGQTSVLVNSSLKSPEQVKKKSKTNSKKTSVAKSKTASVGSSKKNASSLPGVQMTREEIERHLESSQRNKPQFLTIDKVASDLPMEIFSNDNSNVDSEPGDGLMTEDGQDDHDLIIDLPE